MLIGRITLRPRGPAAHLSIYLHPEWCGQGYGPAALLVFQRLQVREGAKLLTLDVATDNHRAIAAYRRAGWSFTSSLVRGEHTYLKMEMELAPNTANCGGDTADDRG
jgi:RimJ/RimL family protein N-acetyltransferase